MTKYSLPNDLGWEVNDEISDAMIKKFTKYAKLLSKPETAANWPSQRAFIKVATAEVMDDVYTRIKKHQKRLGMLK